MKSSRVFVVAACVLGTLVAPASQAGEAALAPEESRYLADGEATRRIAEPYIAAYIARDWTTLETLFHDDGSWSDPTAMQLFGNTTHQGKTKAMAYLREAFAGIEAMRLHPTRTVYSSHFAVIEGTLDWTVAVGQGKSVRTDAMPFVVVLRIKDGKVLQHEDFADYRPFIEAFRQLRKAAP